MLITFTMYPGMWPQCAQWGHGDHIWNVPINVITMCPVGTWWSHSQCTQWWDHNVLSGHMLSSFKMYPVMGSQCPQWAHVGFFHNVPINVFPMSPVAYSMVSFTICFTMCPAYPWATHWEFFKKLSSDVSTMCPTPYSMSSLRIHGKTQQNSGYIEVTLKEAPWEHCDHIIG